MLYLIPYCLSPKKKKKIQVLENMNASYLNVLKKVNWRMLYTVIEIFSLKPAAEIFLKLMCGEDDLPFTVKTEQGKPNIMHVKVVIVL